MLDQLLAFWGKARPSLGGVPSAPVRHPLLAHMLDVGAVGVLLPAATHCGLDRRQLGFLVALHDIGKLSPGFQAKAPECWPETALGPLPLATAGGEHAQEGLDLLDALLERGNIPVFSDESKGGRRDSGWKLALLSAVMGHHGQPVSLDTKEIHDGRLVDYAQDFVDVLLEVFRPPPILQPDKAGLRRLEWILADLTNLADWIGSVQAWFPYARPEDLADPAAYFWNRAIPCAQAAIVRAGLSPAAIAPFVGIRALFDHIREPSPVQSLVETMALPEGPALVVIEDMTGSGKTEAALVLTWRLLSAGRGSGLFVALPTMATANAMYDRLNLAYHRFFMLSARPSLALAHGRARLNERFVAALASDDSLPRPAMAESAEAYCAAWLGSESRRALLAQIGIGTIDQALMAILPVRFATLRQAGLLGKILLIDEVHCFDPYMKEELATLLRFHAAMGGSAILLSATLTRQARQNLVDAFRRGAGVEAPIPLLKDDYPLVTCVSRDDVGEVASEPRPGLARRIAVRRLAEVPAAEAEIARSAVTGAAVAWIRNTVDDVIASAQALCGQGIEVTVFHARFAMADRLAIERDVLARFGKDGAPEGRRGVLLASSVIEQSLDLDFDVLCTDLAPMDLLIQRAGRLRRHRRDWRPIDREELLVIAPEPVEDADAGWIRRILPGTAMVYRDPVLLWRTARALFRRGVIDTPGEIRALIEEAADTRADSPIPPALVKASRDAEGKALSQGGVARMNVLRIESGYSGSSLNWGSDVQIPTRLQERDLVTVRLAVAREGRLLPWAAVTDVALTSSHERHRAWALSEVSVARYHLARCPAPPGLEKALLDARAGWSAWERDAEDRVLLLVLRETGDGWRGEGNSEEGKAVVIKYDRTYGLQVFPAGAG